MIDFFALLIGTSSLGYYAQKVKNKSISSIITLIIIIWFVLYAGLRTRYNDTYNYISWFPYVEPILKFSIKDFFAIPYYGFECYQSAIKYIFNNSQWLIMLSSIITGISYIVFYKKKSTTFGLTILCFIIFGPFTLTCAAIKQCIAMSISLIAINILLKRNYVGFYIMLIIAFSFHPYILIMAIAPLLLDNKVWSKKMVFITIFFMIAAILFSQLLSIILKFTEAVGKQYDMDTMLDHTINPLRVIVDWIPIVISILLRKEINNMKNDTIVFGINMMVVSGIFTFASLFGNPIYIYRTGNYFSSMNAIVIPWMLVNCLPYNKWKKCIIIVFFAFYTLIFIWDFTGFNITNDLFKHTNIMSLFE